jgi:hypothetical protein
MSEPAMTKARNTLKQKNLIDFKAGDGRRINTIYSIIIPNKGKSTFDLSSTLSHTLSDTLSQPLSDQKPLDNTKPKTKVKETKPKEMNNTTASPVYDFRFELIKLVGDEGLVDDFLKVRKIKKAANTETALNIIKKECENHKFPIAEALKICCERNWQGFKYAWVAKDYPDNSFEKKINNLNQTADLAMQLVNSKLNQE